jgi:hypothetical protein
MRKEDKNVRSYDSHQDTIKGKQFHKTVREVQAHMPREIDYALICGLAVAFYANPPVTLDLDFLTTTALRLRVLRLQTGHEGRPLGRDEAGVPYE